MLTLRKSISFLFISLFFLVYSQECPVQQTKIKKESPKFAYATLVTNEEYALGALVLGQTLQETKTPYPKILLTFNNRLTSETKSLLQRVGWQLAEVKSDPIKCPPGNFNNKITHFQETCSKFALWSLLQFSRVIYLDADSMVFKNIDHLFNIDAPFVAVPQPGEPEYFQSAIFVFSPSKEKMNQIITSTYQKQVDGGDIFALNLIFAEEWSKKKEAQLDYTYMITRSANRKVPVNQDGKIDWGSIYVFDFAGPSELKPWVMTNSPDWRKDMFSSENLQYSVVMWYDYLEKSLKPAGGLLSL